ncbi:MAG: ATP-binding protein [Gammaproteobacteria bacterium]|nr:ATP-binding protein [Gammaproteobacteria bacterium]
MPRLGRSMSPVVSRPFFKEEFPSTFEEMTAVLDHAVDALLADGWVQAGQVPCTRLCLEEALVNAVRHGNNSEATRQVTLTMLARGDECVIQVRDEGGEFSVDNIAMPECDQLGGRGICLIRHYMDSVTFDAEAHCLEMSFRRKAC